MWPHRSRAGALQQAMSSGRGARLHRPSVDHLYIVGEQGIDGSSQERGGGIRILGQREQVDDVGDRLGRAGKGDDVSDGVGVAACDPDLVWSWAIDVTPIHV